VTAPTCQRYAAALAAGSIALLTSGVSWIATGATLGLPIASLTFASLILPPVIVIPRQSARGKMLTITAVCAAIGITWIFALISSAGMIPTLEMLLVLAAYLFALGGIALLLAALRFNSTLATAVTVGLSFAWLSWPIWLSSHLTEGRLLSLLVSTHPIFAINGTSDAFGIWTQQHLMYRLTALGQDVPFALPRSVLPCLIAHLIVGAACMLPALIHRAPLREPDTGCEL
jgi:hypothetical protein